MTGNGQAPLRNVAVFGGGLVAHAAALAIARTTPRTAVILIRTPPDPAALADRLPAILPATPMLDQLGLAEQGLIACATATHRVGERFTDWGEDGATWVQGHGPAVPLGMPGALHQHWLERARRGRGPDYPHVVPASALAAAERFVPARPNDRSLLSYIDPALRLDPERMLPILAEQVRRSGMAVRDGAIGGLERAAGGQCAAALLATGERIEADLYVDATGPSASLASRLNDGFVGWGESLPCDRLLLASQGGRPSPTDDYQALGIGWRAAWPLADRTLAGLGYRSDVCGEGRARRVFGTGGDAAETIVIRPGRRRTPLTANVVALGDAAAATGPLGWTGLALAFAHLALLLELLPGRKPDPLLAAEFNRRATQRADRVYDFVASAYLVRPRRKGEFWRSLAGLPLPTGLAETLAQFAKRGSLPHHEEETFSREDWAARLIGLGVRPGRRDPVSMSADPTAVDAALDRLATAAAALAARLPTYSDYLAATARAPR